MQPEVVHDQDRIVSAGESASSTAMKDAVFYHTAALATNRRPHDCIVAREAVVDARAWPPLYEERFAPPGVPLQTPVMSSLVE